MDKSLYGDPDFQPAIIENHSSIVTNRRTELYKIIITRQKREFEAPVTFNDKGPGEEGNGNNFEFKPFRSNDLPSGDRAVLEMGFQTNNEAYEKTYQVPRMRMQNALTQVEKGLGDIMSKLEAKVNVILNDPAKMNSMENFLHKLRSEWKRLCRVMKLLIFFKMILNLVEVFRVKVLWIKKQRRAKVEIRSFRDNLLAGF